MLAAKSNEKGVKPLQINIYKDRLLGARLFGAPVLYSREPIPHEDIPKGWYCSAGSSCISSFSVKVPW